MTSLNRNIYETPVSAAFRGPTAAKFDRSLKNESFFLLLADFVVETEGAGGFKITSILVSPRCVRKAC